MLSSLSFASVRASFISSSLAFLKPAKGTSLRLFVFPSLYEGFGIPPLEAMGCGTPVVCSNASSLPEVVGEAACTVNPRDVDGMADAIQVVLTDRGLMHDLIQKGFSRVSRFKWEGAAQALLQVYEHLGSSARG